MGISRKQLNIHQGTRSFDPALLGERLKEAFPAVDFCLLLGSAKEGVVREGSDLDLAFYLNGSPSLEFYSRVPALVDELLPGVRCDVGILNDTEPVYRFEALKGKLLFARDIEQYYGFFSLTCREYESQMFDYARQLRYRKEATHAV